MPEPFEPLYPTIPLDQVVVNRESRQRRQVDDELKASMARIGLIHPIVLGPGNVLAAGERRLEAARSLGWQLIEYRLRSELSPIEAQIIELEENVRRKDLPWQDNIAAIARIHSLYRSLDSEWTQAETASATGLTIGSISKYLRINSEIQKESLFEPEKDRRITSATTIMEAWNAICRTDSRAEAEGFEELLTDYTIPEVAEKAAQVLAETGELPKPNIVQMPIILPSAPVIEHGSFLDWAPTYSGPKFNLIHCDFPYGIELFSGPQARGAEPSSTPYKDDPKLFETLLRAFCQHTDRFVSLSAHLMFWCRLDAGPSEALVRTTFRELAPSWQFHKFPLIWTKSDNAGIAAEPRFWPRHVYETCLLASRGRRQIVKVVADSYSAPSDRTLHPSTKPEPMLRHFMGMLVDDQSMVFDPTAGSGAALRAADSLGAKLVFGLEIDAGFAESANRELRKSRVLRGASRSVSGTGI